jgi:PAS domain S-box-containing protein
MTSAAKRPDDKAAGLIPPTGRREEMIKGMGDGFVLQDDKSRVLAINPAGVRMAGFANEAEARDVYAALADSVARDSPTADTDPLSLSGFSILDQDDNELPISQWPLSRACRREPFEGVEATIVNPARAHRCTVRFSGTAVPGTEGNPRLFITTMHDITGRRRAETELWEANRRLGVLHDAVAMLLASDEPLALVDQLYERLAELLGMELYFHFAASADGQFHLIAHRGVSEISEELRQADFWRSVCGTVATDRRPAVWEDVQTRVEPSTEVIRRLGITAYVCCPLVARGVLIGTLSFGTRQHRRFSAADITLIQTVCDQVGIALERERSQEHVRNSEERLRLALDAGHMGVFDWDLPAGTVTWDTAIYQMFGCEPGTFIGVREFCERVHPDDRARLAQLQERQYDIAMGEALLDIEFRIVHPDGDVRWIASRGRVSRDENGRPLRINGISFDVTERKRIEELQRLAHVAGQVGTFYWDIPNDKVVFDEQMQQVYGLDAAKPVANLERWYTCVHPHDRADMAKAVAGLFEAQSSNWQYEFRIVRPDGQTRWIEERATLFYDPDGLPRTCIGVDVDITARREAEQALRQSEARFRRLSESGIVGIAFFKADGRLVDANEKFLTMLGCDRAEIEAGLLRWDVLTPPEWRSRTRQAITEFNATGRISPYEKEYFRRDGSRFWVLLGGARLDAEGNGVSFVLDITARKRAEQALQQSEDRFRQAFSFAPIGMVLLDLHGRFLHVNRAYCSIVGYSAEELLQPDFDYQRITHPDDLERTAVNFVRLLSGEIPNFYAEMRYVRKDGGIVWVRASATTQRNAEGEPFQILGLIEDITERKRAEQALQEADRRKDDFLAALGHELRNPLAPIRNAMHVLRLRSAHESHARWAAEVTERQVQQMTRLVDDLLDVSRINRGKFELRDETVDLTDVARRAVEMTMPVIEQRGHHVDVIAPPDPVFVRGDSTRLTQVFANLLSNAAKFTPPQGEIRVMVEPGRDDVLVRVRDSGVGIDTGMLREIFEPFQQFHHGVGQDQAGLGLGLALVQRLTQLHRGSVEAFSEGAGQGSEFRVRLPRSNEELRQRDATIEANEPIGQLRIVVVDDNRDVAESLTQLLKMLGHQAHAVYNGAEALEAVLRLKPDLVICDIGLPDISGHEVAERLRRERNILSPRLVAMTGFARDTEKALRSGFDEWFLKPVDVVTLQSMLARSHRNLSAARGHKN